MSNKREAIPVKGMYCVNCEKTIRKAVKELSGVKSVSASFKDEMVYVNYDDKQVDINAIKSKIVEAGYEPKSSADSTLVTSAILIAILGVYVIAKHLGWLDVFNIIPVIDETVSMSMLFVVGLLTSVHCVAMCGGINLTQGALAKNETSVFKSNLLYNVGRVISYTVIGGVVGGIGSLLSFSGTLRGIVILVVGLAMLVMAFSMLGIFSPLRKFSFHFSGNLYNSLYKKVGSNSSLAIGLLNGLMPCGPLQSMQLYALSTGSVAKGSLSMFLFSLGTVPLMFGFGFVASRLNQKYKKVMLTVSAMLIFIIGLNMISNGFALSGVALPSGETTVATESSVDVAEKATEEEVEISGDIQKVASTVDYSYYEPITVKAGVPVEWTINVPPGKLTGCNSQIIVPEYGLQIPLQEGENVVQFTPTESGVYPFSCWMGMVQSQIVVE